MSSVSILSGATPKYIDKILEFRKKIRKISIFTSTPQSTTHPSHHYYFFQISHPFTCHILSQYTIFRHVSTIFFFKLNASNFYYSSHHICLATKIITTNKPPEPTRSPASPSKHYAKADQWKHQHCGVHCAERSVHTCLFHLSQGWPHLRLYGFRKLLQGRKRK